MSILDMTLDNPSGEDPLPTEPIDGARLVLRWNLKDIKSPRVSRILLSILADLNNASFWIVLICPPVVSILILLLH